MANPNDTIDTSIRRDEMFHARNMIILQDFITAKKILQELIRKRKDAAAPYFHLGYVEIALMAPKEALKNFTKAAILKPEIIKYKQVLRWFTQIYDDNSDQSIKNESDFMTAVVALLHDINATQFEHINVYNTMPKQILSALNDAILLYHPINHHMEKAQQFILNRYSYVTLTRYKHYCITHFHWLEYSCGDVNNFPFYRIRQRNYGHQMVVEKTRSFYPTQPATHSKNGRFMTRTLNYHTYENSPTNINPDMFINKQKRMLLICGFIFDQKYKLKDMIQIIDVFFNENFWEWKVQNTNHMIQFNLIQLQPSKDKYPLHVLLSYGSAPPHSDLFLSIDRKVMIHDDITFIKIYYELYDDETNEKIWKGTKKYRCFQGFCSGFVCERDDKILSNRNTDIASAVLRLLTNNNIQLLIKVIHCEFLTNETYIHNQCAPTQMKSNVSFKWTIPNKYKLKSIQFSENFGNDTWCLYCACIKNPTNKKKKKFYIGVMLLTLPYLDHLKIQLKIQLNIFNDDEKNTKVLTSKVWPGYESSLQIPFKYNILFSSESNKSIDIFVNVKIIKMFKH